MNLRVLLYNTLLSGPPTHHSPRVTARAELAKSEPLHTGEAAELAKSEPLVRQQKVVCSCHKVLCDPRCCKLVLLMLAKFLCLFVVVYVYVQKQGSRRILMYGQAILLRHMGTKKVQPPVNPLSWLSSSYSTASLFLLPAPALPPNLPRWRQTGL